METISFTNPKCMKCPKNETCKNKTMICAYVDTDEINKKSSIDAMQPALEPLRMTSEMLLKEINKKISEIKIEVNNASFIRLGK